MECVKARTWSGGTGVYFQHALRALCARERLFCIESGGDVAGQQFDRIRGDVSTVQPSVAMRPFRWNHLVRWRGTIRRVSGADLL